MAPCTQPATPASCTPSIQTAEPTGGFSTAGPTMAAIYQPRRRYSATGPSCGRGQLTRSSPWTRRGTSYGRRPSAPSCCPRPTGAAVAVVGRGRAGVVGWRWPAPATIEVSPAVAPDGTVVVGPNDDYAYGITS